MVCQPVTVSWGSIEVEPEVVDWLEALTADQFGQVEFHIDRLAESGPALRVPHARQLRGKLWELRFNLGPERLRVRITYYIAPGRRMVLLTVFSKQRMREQTEIRRAYRKMQRCIAEDHTGEDEDG